MNKIFIILTVFCFSIFGQVAEQKSLYQLNNELKISAANYNLEMPAQILETPKKKNTGLAIIYSFLLPGMGELYAESYESGKYFTITEGLLLGTYIGINTYGNWQQNRYKSFAAANGSVDLSGKDEQYFATISEYLSIEEYNDQKALERNFSEMLNEKNYFWKWTPEDRKSYRSMWVSSEHAYNNLRFVVGAMIVNRIASAINAVRLVSKYNKQQAEELSWNISAGVENSINLPNHFTLNFQTKF